MRKTGATENGKVTPEYTAWRHMIDRCLNHPEWAGRGILVCERWKNFENFLADMGRRPDPKLTLERKDNDQGYFKENCEWATRTAQNRNRRIYKTCKTGYPCIFQVRPDRFRAYTRGLKKHIGYFKTLEEAIAAQKAVV